MRIEGHQGIVLGPGGEIRNVPENKELLELLENAPVLKSEALLKLAGFYKAYLTNIPLGNHLALLALATQVSRRTVHEVFPEFDAPDWYEDTIVDGADESKEPADDSHDTFQLFVRRIPVAGIGLLVETLVLPEKKYSKPRHFFIGISPLA